MIASMVRSSENGEIAHQLWLQGSLIMFGPSENCVSIKYHLIQPIKGILPDYYFQHKLHNIGHQQYSKHTY